MTVKTYTIELDYNASKANASLAQFRTGVIRQFNELNAATAKLDVLKDLEKDAKGANDAVVKLKDRSDELTRILGKLKAGDVGFKQLSSESKAAEKDLRAAEKAAGAIADKIRQLDGELRAAGIDTKNLAAEQTALAKALDEARRAVSTQAARQSLGVVGADEARAEIAGLRESYELLRASGTASIAELAKAKQLLTQRTIEANAQQSLFAGNLREVGVAVVGLVGSVAAYTAGIRGAVIAAAQYEQGLAAIASITSLNKRQLDELGAGVLRLAGRIGVDAVDAFRALYNIIGSGIPAENSLRVLEASAKAAVAGITSIENAARISVQVLNAYQLQVGQIDRVHDILFQTVRDGVISFEELADKFGVVLPAARSAGVSLEELSAATVVLTRNGLSAPRAMTALEGAIKQLAAPTVDAAAAMNELGISYNGFAGTIEQLASKNIGADLLRRLIPDVEGQRAIALLTRQTSLFKSSLEEANGAAGATAEAFNKLKNTPEQAYKRFTAEVNNLQVASGKALLQGIMPMLDGVTELIRAYAGLPAVVRDGVGVIAAVGGALGVAAIAARSLTPLLAPMAAGLAEMGAAGAIAAGGVNAARLAIVNLLPVLVGGALGYEFGKSWRENDAIIRSFGDALGGTIGYLKEGAGGLADFAVAAARADFKGLAAAVEKLSNNEAQYRETLLTVNPAVADLEIAQRKLREELERSQKAVGEAGAKFRDAFAEVIEAVDKPLNAVNARIEVTTKQIESALARMAASSDAAKGLFQAQSATIERALVDQTNSIELLLAKREISEAQSIARLTAANIKANDERLKVLNDYRDRAIKAFEIEAAARISLAQKSGADQKLIETQIATGRIALINELSTKYGEYIAGAKRAEESLRDKIKDVDTEIRGIRAEQAAFQNRVTAAVSGDVVAYYDRQSRAESLLAQAQRASGEDRMRLLAEAKTLAGTLGQAVSDSYGRQIDAARAASIAEGIANRASEQQIGLLNEKKKALADAASQYAASGEKIQGESVNIKAQLDRLFPDTGKKIGLAVDYDKDQLKEKLDSLQADLLQQAPLANVKLSVDQALAAYEVFKQAIERDKPVAEVQAKFDAFKQSYKEVNESLPLVNLTPDTKRVDEAFNGIAAKVVEFNRNKLELQSNVDDVAAKIKSLTAPTRSVHTIELRYEDTRGNPTNPPAGAVPAPAPANFANGGLVSFDGVKAQLAAQRFAKGGFVGRVPGVGNGDTEFRMLQAGSFVLRKDAVRQLIDKRSLQGRLANGVAGAATDGSIDSIIEALNATPVFDRAAPMANMFAAAFREQEQSIAALRAKFPLGYVEPGAEAFSRALAQPKVDIVRAQYDTARARRSEAGANAATASAIDIAKGIATPARGLSFDDLKAFAEAEAADKAEAAARSEAQKAGMSFEDYLLYIEDLRKKEAEAKAQASQSGAAPQKKASGGAISGRDLVPAMLTPGEVVFSPRQVNEIGLRNLMAMNALKFNAGGIVPAAFQDVAMAPLMHLHDRMQRFNLGGVVAGATSVDNSTNYGGVSAPITINAPEGASVRQIARAVADELSNIDRRRR